MASYFGRRATSFLQFHFDRYAAPPGRGEINMSEERNIRINYVLKESTVRHIEELMLLDQVKSQQVWVTRLIKKYFSLGPAKREHRSSSLMKLRGDDGEAVIRLWLKLTAEEDKQLKELCKYHDCVTSYNGQIVKYHYSSLIWQLVSNSYHLRLRKKPPKVEPSKPKNHYQELLKKLEGD